MKTRIRKYELKKGITTYEYVVLNDKLESVIEREFGSIRNFYVKYLINKFGLEKDDANIFVEKIFGIRTGGYISFMEFLELIDRIEIKLIEEWEGELGKKILDTDFLKTWFTGNIVEG
jgi:hypothetical protein